MKPLRLDEIREAAHGRWLYRGEPALVHGVTTDTRTARPGELFFAIRGEQFDGHTFLSQAADAECIAGVVRLDGEPSPDIAKRFAGGVIGVRETVRALGQLGGYHRSLVPAAVVGVTGSNGKTTVKEMIHHILSTRLTGTCAPKSYNNQIGVPLSLLAASGGDEYTVCEIGSSAPGEVAALGGMARPDVAVITGVAEAHLEYFGSLERVAGEKASILRSLDDDGLAVINADNEMLDRAVRGYQVRTIRYGISDSAELRLTAFEPRGYSQRFELNGRIRVDLRLPGRHNAMNALAAIAVAQRFGFSQEESALALGEFEGVEMRLQCLDCGDLTLINDAYNSNPTSMLAAASVLRESPGTARKVLVAGDMREMGDESEQIHLSIGRRIGEPQEGDSVPGGIDLLIGVGLLGRYIADGASEVGLETVWFDSVDEASKRLPELLMPKDVVLIKGSRVMRMERLIPAIQEAFAR